ncbi:MAG: NifU family protein [Chloroflexi bacterium]|nr:NifU family protein [Chloroflexota bacterium]
MDVRIKIVVDSLAGGIRSDGGDLTLVSVCDGIAEVNYVIHPHACDECLMSADELAVLLKAALEAQDLGIKDVAITLLDERRI